MPYPQDRAAVLGYVAVSYGIGFAVGPAIGGLLGSVSLQFGAWVATGGSLLSLALVLGLMPGGWGPVCRLCINAHTGLRPWCWEGARVW